MNAAHAVSVGGLRVFFISDFLLEINFIAKSENDRDEELGGRPADDACDNVPIVRSYSRSCGKV